MELFAADGHDAGGCERVTGKSGMRPQALPRVPGRNPADQLDAAPERRGRGRRGPGAARRGIRSSQTRAWPSPSFMSMLARRSGVRGGPPPSRRRLPDAGRRGTSQRCRMAPRTPAVARCRCGESAWHSRSPATRPATVSVNSGSPGVAGVAKPRVAKPRRSGRPTCSRSATTRSRSCPPPRGLRNRERGVSTEQCKDSDRYKVFNLIGVTVCNSIPRETHRGPARVRPSVPWSP